MKKRVVKNSGSSFESFLRDEGLFDIVDEAAVKRVLAWQLADAMKQRKIDKSKLARRMETSRTQVDRLLDPKNSSITLHRAAAVLGLQLRVVMETAKKAA
jgi:antitoxin HicB